MTNKTTRNWVIALIAIVASVLLLFSGEIVERIKSSIDNAKNTITETTPDDTGDASEGDESVEAQAIAYANSLELYA